MSIPASFLPQARPALVVHAREARWLGEDGRVERLAVSVAAQRIGRGAQPIVCHRPALAARLGVDLPPLPDILELFAFVRPARFVVPTVAGIAQALGQAPPRDPDEEARMLAGLAGLLLDELAATAKALPQNRQGDWRGVAFDMAQAGWRWGEPVLAALGGGEGRGWASWRVVERLGEWSEGAPPPPPGDIPVDPGEARHRLDEILGEGAEQRPGQSDYASAAALAFTPRRERAQPNLVLAEAGTGTGKTLGYIAPASLWAERNEAPVWISTYTRNLQRQIDAELARLHPDPRQRAARVVIRKGRENYLCLLNLDEAVTRLLGQGVAQRPADAVLLGLAARWAEASRDGDMIGGDLPGWMGELLGPARLAALADRRGECIYSACPHFRKCFIEKTVRRARQADIVIANHALVMTQAAFGGLDDQALPTRYVFDEGHHLFDAADAAFAASLSGLETAELRRWLLGAETESRTSRARGLYRRTQDLVGEQGPLAERLDEILAAARVLPALGWHQRLGEGQPAGLTEDFLALVRAQVLARAVNADGPHALECDPRPPNPGVIEAAAALKFAFDALRRPLEAFAKALLARLDDEAEDLDTQTRQRIEAVAKSIERRALVPLAAWSGMLADLAFDKPEDFVDWFAIERIDGRDFDIGYERHWIDPTRPFAKMVIEPAHGVVVTSATLRDGSGDVEADWAVAEQRTGAVHLAGTSVRAALSSPFDYKAATRVFIVTDVRKDDLDQVAAAYRALFLAAGGGGLGLFTAISRLKAVQSRIAPALGEAGIDLFAQHVGGMDTSTLVDIFRAVENACLLGTDAVRDGVDVPGQSLRLIVFDRVPWPRPDLLHKVRRAHFGAKAYDDMITRLRLKQAFGRLVRRADDAGVFVLLDPMMPSRLFGAFPEGVVPERLGLADAVEKTRAFIEAGRAGPREPGGLLGGPDQPGQQA